MKQSLLAFSFLLCVAASATPEIVLIQERAQGQSLAGSHQLTDSLYSNPAGTAFSNIYAMEATYLGPRAFAAAVVDTKTSSIGGGLTYFRVPTDDDQNYNQGIKLGLSKTSEFGFLCWPDGKVLWG